MALLVAAVRCEAPVADIHGPLESVALPAVGLGSAIAYVSSQDTLGNRCIPKDIVAVLGVASGVTGAEDEGLTGGGPLVLVVELGGVPDDLVADVSASINKETGSLPEGG